VRYQYDLFIILAYFIYLSVCVFFFLLNLSDTKLFLLYQMKIKKRFKPLMCSSLQLGCFNSFSILANVRV